MKKFLVEMSARHVHVTEADLETLFGKGAKLTPKKDLSQPGQFACEERVDVVGPKGTLPHVSILGPTRSATQIEVSATEARKLGVAAPVRESGDVAGSAPCKLVGPAGEVELSEGVIVAKRHVHMTPEDAAAYGVSDKEIVQVKVDTPERSLIFGDVVIRVSDKFATAMHIDTDEANAAGNPREGEFVK
ncbi:phosphate propanoyltransferase [Acetanaerobacterium sp. MSJ-12]|uniref:Phosphate propanoyltransferase n=1 Tax=Bittarella massiliensis (ex Durand et al. 2017) TaxID=1720313 RepID=A0AAQ1MCB2_9FIRM|nr:MULTISPECIES: phosphate propanoyltransferase [Eubacteriales]MCB5941782.1 phosphate propanoyltransferase [bacterium 210820-DFI.6.52]ERI99051.1 propanediol utilization protein PduL [Clostridium sp. ATCC 29733]MBU5420166.1 phosphate propanoyltransferase [Acetanaerobacterium sp. MSJ-12]MCQ4949941.1 phosphate propanoyltransferase [Bittarella massiliensis (ex Durand et al. 2017)]MZL68500.1 phosphate propanoyltransferase [Bittarella massiliensis (ex Durand et al. 2017)]